MPKINLTNTSDENLLLLLQVGNEAAFKEIFDRYDRLLFLYVYRILQSNEDAKDVVQDIFINLWNKKDHLTINTSLKSYLYSAVRNRALNVLRSKDIANRYIASLQMFMEVESSATDYLIREKDITLLIEKEIALLPPKMREVFELRRKNYLSNREIAEYMHVSEHTVATHIKRALKVLKLRLGTMLFLLLLQIINMLSSLPK